MTSPLVSIVMPVYGVERYVGDAVRSILSQSMPRFELIVVDDASPDRSMSVVESFGDPRIRIIRHEQNAGLAAARNTGISHAQAPYIALLDSDDLSPPQRLARQLAAFEREPGLLGCGGSMHRIDSDGRQLTPLRPAETLPQRINATLLFRNSFFVSSMMFRRSVFSSLRYRSEFRMAEDYEFMVRVSRLGALRNLDDVLLHYRVHAESLTFKRPQLMDNCRRRIAREQLQRLGIEPTEVQLDLHMHAANPSSDANRQRIKDVLAWLHRLEQLNQAAQIYAQPAFSDVLADSWFEVCTLGSGLGPWAMASYLRAKLPGTVSVALSRQLRFAAKCIVGLRRDAWRGNTC